MDIKNLRLNYKKSTIDFKNLAKNPIQYFMNWFEDALKVSLMLQEQPMLVDTVFYPVVNLYPNQLSIADNRVIYSDIKFTVDPLFKFENELRLNRQQQYKNRIQLESMTWKN